MFGHVTCRLKVVLRTNTRTRTEEAVGDDGDIPCGRVGAAPPLYGVTRWWGQKPGKTERESLVEPV